MFLGYSQRQNYLRDVILNAIVYYEEIILMDNHSSGYQADIFCLRIPLLNLTPLNCICF